MYLGLDIAKAKIDCCLMHDTKYLHRTFENNQDGFIKLSSWIEKHTANKVYACCEATGSYSEAIADYLHDTGHKIAVVNPLRIKAFVTSELQNVKTDKQDAKSIAIYCQRNQPQLYKPASPSERELKALTRYLDGLKDLLTSHTNRSLVAHHSVKPYIETSIKNTRAEIKVIEKVIQSRIKSDDDLDKQAKLLKSITAISDGTIPHILTLFADKQFKTAKQATKYVGLNPIIKQSGNKSTRHLAISKMGDKYIRSTLYMPAVVAFRMAVYKPFIKRLKDKGKTNKQIICAMMRKLLVYCFTVLKTGNQFDPKTILNHQS